MAPFVDKNSLKLKCLQGIVENLTRFSYAFIKNTDPDLERSFDFLQRYYSKELHEIVSQLGPAKEGWIPLLISKYLRELDLKILRRFDDERIERIICGIGEGLLKISFSGRSFQRQNLLSNIFPHLKNLTVLSLKSICNDEALENIAKHCPHLIELNIMHSWFTARGFVNHLCKENENNEVPNSKLRKLRVSYTRADCHDIAQLILLSFPHLEVLECYRLACTLHKMHWKDFQENNVRKKYKLTLLNAETCEHLITKPEILNLFTIFCPDVTMFAAELTKPEQLGALVNFTKLNDVLLISRMQPFLAANDFLCSRGAMLTILRLHGFRLSIEELMKNCPLLEKLQLKNVSFQPLVGARLEKLKFLKVLALEDFKSGNAERAVCILLSHGPKLEEIKFSGCLYFKLEILSLFTLLCPDVTMFAAELTKPEHLRALANFRKLNDVLLISRMQPLLAANDFLGRRGAMLTVLRLHGFCLCIEELMKNCPLLEKLQLKNVSFQPLVGARLGKLKFLKVLSIEEFDSGNAEGAVGILLSHSPKLEKIKFSGCLYFNDDLETDLARCCLRCPLKKIILCDMEFNLSLVQSILVNSFTLNSLRIINQRFSDHREYFSMNDMMEIARRAINKICLIIEYTDKQPHGWQWFEKGD